MNSSRLSQTQSIKHRSSSRIKENDYGPAMVPQQPILQQDSFDPHDSTEKAYTANTVKFNLKEKKKKASSRTRNLKLTSSEMA